MKIYFITGNKNKLEEIKSLFSDIPEIEIENLKLDLPEIQELDSKKVILEKIEVAKLDKSLKNIFVEDTSLCFDYFNGFPGPLIKWLYTTAGPQKISEMLKPNNKATAIVSIGFYDGKDTHFFEGRVTGKIVSPRGDDRFAWDLIFMPDGYDKTYAEMPIEEKNKISMRRLAILKFKEYLVSQLKG